MPLQTIACCCCDSLLPIQATGNYYCNQCKSTLKITRKKKVWHCEEIITPSAPSMMRRPSSRPRPRIFRPGYPNSPLTQLGLEESAPLLGHQCVICKVPLTELTTTIAKLQKVRFVEEVISEQPLLVETRPRYSSVTVRVCPDHALSVVGHTEFPYSHG